MERMSVREEMNSLDKISEYKGPCDTIDLNWAEARRKRRLKRFTRFDQSNNNPCTVWSSVNWSSEFICPIHPTLAITGTSSHALTSLIVY